MPGPMFTVSFEGGRDLVAHFVSMPAKLREALLQATTGLALELEQRVEDQHLSGPTGPHTLSVGKNVKGHTGGQLKASVFHRVESSESSVTGIVGYGADVPYAAIHEFGGTINIPEITPVRAKALHFFIGDKEVFAKKVRAHTVRMPERAPLRTSLEEMKPTIISRYEQAVQSVIDKP